MYGRRYYPAGYGTAPGLYAPSLFNPFRGLLGGSLMIAGVIVIMNMLAPQLLESALPNWKLRYGGIIIAAVMLGFIRSIFRMFIPLAALGFWIFAMFALIHTSVPTSFALPKLPSFSAQTAPTPVVSRSTPTMTQPLHGSRSLPDSAYLPAQNSAGLGAISKIPGVSWLKKLFR